MTTMPRVDLLIEATILVKTENNIMEISVFRLHGIPHLSMVVEAKVNSLKSLMLKDSGIKLK